MAQRELTLHGPYMCMRQYLHKYPPRFTHRPRALSQTADCKPVCKTSSSCYWQQSCYPSDATKSGTYSQSVYTKFNWYYKKRNSNSDWCTTTVDCTTCQNPTCTGIAHIATTTATMPRVHISSKHSPIHPSIYPYMHLHPSMR